MPYTTPTAIDRQREIAAALSQQQRNPNTGALGGLAHVLRNYGAYKGGVNAGQKEMGNEGLRKRDNDQLIQLLRSGIHDRRGVQGMDGSNMDVIPETRMPDLQHPDSQAGLAQVLLNREQQGRVLTPEQEAQKIRISQHGSAEKFGNNPLWMQDEKGDWIAGQTSSSGGFKTIDIPENMTLSRPQYEPETQRDLKYAQTTGGLEAELDLSPDVIAAEEQAKVDVFLANSEKVGAVEALKAYNIEIQKIEGKSVAEAATMLKDMEANMPHLEQVVKELAALSETATHTLAGRARDTVTRELNLGVGEGGIARAEYISKVDNEILPLLKPTFGAAFTVKEGDALRATLGNPNVSPGEKKAVLRSFISTKQAQVISLSDRTQAPVSGDLNADEIAELEQLRRDLANE